MKLKLSDNLNRSESSRLILFFCFFFPLRQPSDDDTVSLHSQVSETARADALSLLSKMDSCKGYRK